MLNKRTWIFRLSSSKKEFYVKESYGLYNKVWYMGFPEALSMIVSRKWKGDNVVIDWESVWK